jgi:hypothetical protein
VNRIVVVDTPGRWLEGLPDVQTVDAEAYLIDPRYSELRRATVFNLCRNRLPDQATALSAARGRRPPPSVATPADWLSPLVRIISGELEELLEEPPTQSRS